MNTEQLIQYAKDNNLLDKADGGGCLDAAGTQFPLPFGGTLLVVQSYYNLSAFYVSPTGEITELEYDELIELEYDELIED